MRWAALMACQITCMPQSLSIVTVSVPSLSQVMFMDRFPHLPPDLNPNVIFHLLPWNHLFFLLYCFSFWPSDGADLWPPQFCLLQLFVKKLEKKMYFLHRNSLIMPAECLSCMFWSRVILTQSLVMSRPDSWKNGHNCTSVLLLAWVVLDDLQSKCL